MARGLVYLLAKVPCAGRVKTRLCPPLTPRRAARLAEAFAVDLLTMLATLNGPDGGDGPGRQPGQGGGRGPEIRLALAGEAFPGAGSTAAGRLKALAASLDIPVEGQGDGDLGVRMHRLMDRGLEQGRPTLLIGSDVPDLPRERVAEALSALQDVDAVVGPAADGGYVLIGSRRPVPGMFEIDAAWGGPGVLSATCAALGRSGYTYRTLAPWEDVDDAVALGRLASRLEGHDGKGGRDGGAASTARLLASWGRQGVRF